MGCHRQQPLDAHATTGTAALARRRSGGHSSRRRRAVDLPHLFAHRLLFPLQMSPVDECGGMRHRRWQQGIKSGTPLQERLAAQDLT